MADKRLTVRIDAQDRASDDLRKFNRNLRDTGEQVGRVSKSFSGLKVAVAGAVAAFSVRELVAFGREMFQVGASVAETESKFKTVFGTATDAVQEFIDTFATMAGLTEREARDVTATMGAIGQGMGQTAEQSAEFAQAVVRLAGDLASFNDVPIRDTLRDIQSGLAGQIEPLRKYGIELDAYAVQAKGAELAGKAFEAQLTNQEKLAGRLALAYARAGVQVDDLTRTKNSAANQARQLAAEFGNIRDEIATALLPALSQMLPVLRGIADVVAEQIPNWADWFTVVGDFFGLIDRSVVELERKFASLGTEILEISLQQAVDAQVRLLAEQERALDAVQTAEAALVEELTRREFATKQTATAVDTAVADLARIRSELAEWTEQERLLRQEIEGRAAAQAKTSSTAAGGSTLPALGSGTGDRTLAQIESDLPRRLRAAAQRADLSDIDPFAPLTARIKVLQAELDEAFEIDPDAATTQAISAELLNLQRLLASLEDTVAFDIDTSSVDRAVAGIRTLGQIATELPGDLQAAVQQAALSSLDPFAGLRAQIGVLQVALRDALRVDPEALGATTQAISTELLRLQGQLNQVRGPIDEFSTELVGDFEALGQNMIRGLMAGTADMGDILKSFIVSFAAKFLLGPLSGFLGVFSPSRVTAGYGRDVVAGMIVGMQRAGPGLTAESEATAARALQPFADLPAVTVTPTIETIVPPIDLVPEFRVPDLPPLEVSPPLTVTPHVMVDAPAVRSQIAAATGSIVDSAVPLATPQQAPLSGTDAMLGNTAPTLRIAGLPDERANPFSPWILRWLSDAQIQVELNRG